MQNEHEWRCGKCGKLMGVHNGARLHIRYAKGHEYLVSVPATGTCRGCGTLNELRNASQEINGKLPCLPA